MSLWSMRNWYQRQLPPPGDMLIDGIIIYQNVVRP